MDNPTIFRMLDVSTAHLSPAQREYLSKYPGVIADERSYGWLLFVPEHIDEHIAECTDDDDEYGNVPEAVVAIWRKAAEHDCRYVLLDQDASVVDGLPTYED